MRISFQINSLKFQFFVSNTFQIVTVILGFGRIFFFSKILIPADFGILSYFLSFLSFIPYVTTFGSFQYLLKIGGVSKRELFTNFEASLILNTVINFVIIFFCFLVPNTIQEILEIKGYWIPFIIIIITNFLYSSSTLFSYLHYGLGNIGFYSLIEFLKTSLWVIVSISFYVFSDSSDQIYVYYSIVAATFVPFLIGIVTYQPILQNITKTVFKQILVFCIPLFPYFLSIWGIALIVRSVINVNLGPSSLAIFAIAFGLLEVLTNVVSNFTTALLPKFYSNTSNNDSKKWINLSILLSILLLILLAPPIFIFKEIIIQVFASEKYLPSGKYIVFISIIPILKIITNNMLQVYLKESRTLYISVVYLLSLLFSYFSANILINVLFDIQAVFISLSLTYGIIFILLLPEFLKYTIGYKQYYFNLLVLYLSILIITYTISELEFQIHIKVVILLSVYLVAIVPITIYLKNKINDKSIISNK